MDEHDTLTSFGDTPFDGRLRGERREHPTSYVKCGECGAAKFNPIHDREQPYFFRHDFVEPSAT